MTSRRSAAVVTAGTVLALSGLSAVPASAHGSMTDPVSRVSACYAEGPESPKSAACKAAVAASGTQAFYDWNAVNIANAAGQHRRLIPDGRLCSAGNDKYRGLDLARADWPASRLDSGAHTFRYKGTAPHKGSFELYVTKDGYDPSKPLKWSDLEAKPFLTVTDPGMQNGDYVFRGTVPKKSGRHLIYSIWQRSDSPEAFYTCSDVVFGQDGGSPAPSAGAPTDQQIEDGADQSSVEHGGHGDDDPATGAGHTGTGHTDAGHTGAEGAGAAEAGTAGTGGEGTAAPVSSSSAPAAPATPNAPAPAGASGSGVELAETGGGSTTPYLAIGGAAVLAVGAAVLFGTARRRRA
ncbi:lytic polysaccharide monooxygenase [Streptomyces sp. WAC08241]|uniref:lytic polysaccharide monooxygenase auxiliary activity family 9 protein n=1 Tax=Streptomyces sp. WAC08241 TaxID=2487421 RepID=UPI000F7B430C|nr:lytic polysaccharide monooxygenase [Streptomyces sp. WAC08241]RSS41516.1 LPXTG cell wall anchor domain-containing protein [Streptomyces sp. WAC08241]